MDLKVTQCSQWVHGTEGFVFQSFPPTDTDSDLLRYRDVMILGCTVSCTWRDCCVPLSHPQLPCTGLCFTI